MGISGWAVDGVLPVQVVLFSVIKRPCFRLSRFKQNGPSGPVFGDQVDLFSVDKNIRNLFDCPTGET